MPAASGSSTDHSVGFGSRHWPPGRLFLVEDLKDVVLHGQYILDRLGPHIDSAIANSLMGLDMYGGYS